MGKGPPVVRVLGWFTHLEYELESPRWRRLYCVMGEGPPLVSMPNLFSHLQLEWKMAELRRVRERLAERRKLVRYDGVDLPP